MLHAERQAARSWRRKNAPFMAPCPFWHGVGDVRRGALCGGTTGGCRGGSEPSRGRAAVRDRPPDGEEDAELFVAAWLPADQPGSASQAGRVHRHTGSPASSTRSWMRTRIRTCRASSGKRRIGSSSGCGTSTGSRAGIPSRPCENSGWGGDGALGHHDSRRPT